MKKFIQWLARVFNADITVTAKETVVKTQETKVYIPENGIYEGDLYVKGNLYATGSVTAEGSITANEIH